LINSTITPENLKMLRAKFGNTQYELSKLLNLSVAQFSKKEKGLAPFTLVEAKIIADYYNLPIEDVFFRNIVCNNESPALKIL